MPLGGSICPTTRNLVDGDIQSSRWGVDVWNIPKPHYCHHWSKSLQNFPMSSDILGVADLFVKNNSWRNNKKRHRFHLLTIEEIESDFCTDQQTSQNDSPKRSSRFGCGG